MRVRCARAPDSGNEIADAGLVAGPRARGGVQAGWRLGERRHRGHAEQCKGRQKLRWRMGNSFKPDELLRSGALSRSFRPVKVGPSADDEWNGQVEQWSGLLVVALRHKNDWRGAGVVGRAAAVVAAADIRSRPRARARLGIGFRQELIACRRLPCLAAPGGRQRLRHRPEQRTLQSGRQRPGRGTTRVEAGTQEDRH